MHKASRYWTLRRLNAAGQIKTIVLSNAQVFFQQHFPTVMEPASMEQESPADASLQRQLFALRASTDTKLNAMAELCLRCFISHQIVQVCTSIQAQFGQYYGFTLQDLLPCVLNDDGKVPANPQCLAMQILQNFQPTLSSLATWTTRTVKQNHGFNRVLVEHGLYLISDWAILNDTKPSQLPVILSNLYSFSATEVNQNCVLLESYRQVYLPDRLQQGRRQCADPTPEQLQRMSALIQAKTAILIAPTTLFVLGVALLLAKGTVLLLKWQRRTPLRRVWVMLAIALYGLAGLQLYLAGIVLPWLLPSVLFWVSVEPVMRKKVSGT